LSLFHLHDFHFAKYTSKSETIQSKHIRIPEREMWLMKFEDFHFFSESPRVLMQAATDPENPNKWPNFPPTLQQF
jgi:hypothetical protein